MKHIISFFSLFTFLASTPFPLHAQKEEVTLEEVVVTATRDVEEIRKIPASVAVITKEEIEQSNARATVDLLRDEVGVVVRDFYGNGKTASVDIRGFGESSPLNVLVLVDGRRVNEIDLSGTDWTQIPIEQIERIEIVRGSGSVLYGDNAPGGVINIITKKPEKPFSARVAGAVGGYQYSKGTGSAGGTWGPLSAVLNAGYNSTEGYRDNGLLRAKDVGGKIIYDLYDNVSFNLGGSFHEDKEGLPGGLTLAQIHSLGRRATVNPDNTAKTDDRYGLLGTKIRLPDFGRMEADLSYRHREVESFLDFPASSFTDREERRSRTLGFTPKYVLDKPLANFANKLILGYDFYRSNAKVDSNTIFFGTPSSNQSEVTKRSAGLYFLDEFSLLKNLILSLGYRHEWVKYDLFNQSSQLRTKVRDHEPAWNLGLNYIFDKKSSAFVTVKRSFRFPVSDELIVLDLNTFQYKVNPDMKPQKGYDYEAGVRYAFTDQIEASATFFWIDTKDEIFLNPVTFNNENFPKTRRQGFEIGGKAALFPWLSLCANYSYIRPTLRSDLVIDNTKYNYSGNDIPGVPRHKGSFGGDVELGKGFLFSTRANIVGSRFLISDWANQVDKLNSYYTLDAKLSYAWKGLQAFIGVNNLTDQEYSEWAATNAAGTRQLFYPSPERNFIGGISYSF